MGRDRHTEFPVFTFFFFLESRPQWCFKIPVENLSPFALKKQRTELGINHNNRIMSGYLRKERDTEGESQVWCVNCPNQKVFLERDT